MMDSRSTLTWTGTLRADRREGRPISFGWRKGRKLAAGNPEVPHDGGQEPPPPERTSMTSVMTVWGWYRRVNAPILSFPMLGKA